MTASQLIRREYGASRNIMTPRRIKVGKVSPNVAYELSSGTGIDRQPIYGVSVVMYHPATDTTERVYSLSAVFQSLQAAQDHIETLRLL